MHFRTALPTDIDEMRTLLMTEGPNDWNYLPEDGVAQEFDDVRSGRGAATLAVDADKIVGFAIYYTNKDPFPALPHTSPDRSTVGYIGDVVVSKSCAGKGLGSKLLEEAKSALAIRGMAEVFIDCHEENLASRGMMRKAGFKEVSIFPDPERRWAGSRRTCVCSVDLTGNTTRNIAN